MFGCFRYFEIGQNQTVTVGFCAIWRFSLKDFILKRFFAIIKEQKSKKFGGKYHEL